MKTLEVHFTGKNRRRISEGLHWWAVVRTCAFTAEGAGSIPRRGLRSQKWCGMAKKTAV